VLNERRLAHERPLAAHAVQDALLDEVEDRLPDGRERDAELGCEVPFGLERVACPDLALLDPRGEELPQLVVQRHG